MLTRRLFTAAALSVAASAGLAQGRKGVGDDPFAEGGGDDPFAGGNSSGNNSSSGNGPPAQVINVAGRYSAQGMNGDGSRYTGEVAITQDGTRIGIAWRVGSDNYSGEGLIDGRIVAVDWGSGTPVVYVVMPDGELHGTWDDGRALEKLIPR